MATRPEKTTRFDARMIVRCPQSLPRAIDQAAARRLMSPSEYIRRSIIDRLSADGFDPALV